MMISRSFAFLAILGFASLSLLSCSDDNSKDSAKPVTKYGELKTTLLQATEVRVVDLTTAACAASSDTGLFTGVFTAATGQSLDIKIKDFTTSPRTYTCIQAESNRDGDLGDKYSGCAIEFTVMNPVAGFDTYSTLRTDEKLDAFTYAAACTVTTIYATGKLTLAVNCKDMVQTKYRSSLRNPVDPTAVASLADGTAVECAL